MLHCTLSNCQHNKEPEKAGIKHEKSHYWSTALRTYFPRIGASVSEKKEIGLIPYSVRKRWSGRSCLERFAQIAAYYGENPA
jgi:hypothetical protein